MVARVTPIPPVAGMYILVVVRFLGPRAKTTKKTEATCFFWAPADVILGPPTQFLPLGAQIQKISDPTPPIKCKTHQIWATLK